MQETLIARLNQEIEETVAHRGQIYDYSDPDECRELVRIVQSQGAEVSTSPRIAGALTVEVIPPRSSNGWATPGVGKAPTFELAFMQAVLKAYRGGEIYLEP